MLVCFFLSYSTAYFYIVIFLYIVSQHLHLPRTMNSNNALNDASNNALNNSLNDALDDPSLEDFSKSMPTAFNPNQNVTDIVLHQSSTSNESNEITPYDPGEYKLFLMKSNE